MKIIPKITKKEVNMEEINKIIGKNLLILRKNAKLTQLEFAEKFNYSDKSISKWEAGESLPSIEILYEVAQFYGVTLDSLTKGENILEETEKIKPKKQKMFPSHLIITLLSCCCVWLIATILFTTFKIINDINYPIIFMWTVPLTCLVIIVFNSIWGKFKYLFPILTIVLWTLLVCLHVQIFLLTPENIWPVYFIGIPLQVGIVLWGALVKKRPNKAPKLIKDDNK